MNTVDKIHILISIVAASIIMLVCSMMHAQATAPLSCTVTLNYATPTACTPVACSPVSCTPGTAVACTPVACSPTAATGASIMMFDSASNLWTVSGGVVMENGVAAGFSQGVTALAYIGGNIYQENNANLWWEWQPAIAPPWVSVPSPLPLPPPVVKPPVVTGQSVALTWTAPLQVTVPSSYIVYRSATPTGVFAEIGTTPANNYTDSTVVSGKSYTYQVTSLSATGVNSIPSNQFTVSIP